MIPPDPEIQKSTPFFSGVLFIDQRGRFRQYLHPRDWPLTDSDTSGSGR
jgi:hypothetical protein